MVRHDVGNDSRFSPGTVRRNVRNSIVFTVFNVTNFTDDLKVDRTVDNERQTRATRNTVRLAFRNGYFWVVITKRRREPNIIFAGSDISSHNTKTERLVPSLGVGYIRADVPKSCLVVGLTLSARTRKQRPMESVQREYSRTGFIDRSVRFWLFSTVWRSRG